MARDDGMLLERDAEIDRIRCHLQQVAAGRGGALVIEGPAGIGKTLLLGAASAAAQREGFRVLRARGAELEREFAFGVVRQLVEPLLAQASGAERAAVLEGPAGVAASLLALPGASEALGDSPPVASDPSFAVLHGLYWLCANLAAQRPVALVVDDGQWADGASLRFLTYLMPRLQELRLSVLLGTRPMETGAAEFPALVLDPATEALRPRPLTLDGVFSLIAARLRSAPERDFVAACREATGGVPFLVRALVAALAEQGIAPVGTSAARVPSVATDTVGRWAVLQLRRLGAETTRLGRTVAVLERTDLVEAAALSGLELAEAARATQLLARAGLVEERPLAFAHPILRAGVYGAMPAADRAEEHRRAAGLLAQGGASAERIAEHLLASAPAGDAWVAEQLRAAAQLALARGAPESAAAYLRRALAEPPPPEARAGVLLNLGLTELGASQPGWEDHLRAALAAAEDDPIRANASVHLATALFFGQRTAEAVEVCDRATACLDESKAQARSMLEALAVLNGMHDAATAPAMAERSRSLIVRAGERSTPNEIVAVAAYHGALANEAADEITALARRAIAAPPPSRPPLGALQWMSTACAVRTLFWTERYAEAEEFLNRAVVEARASANAVVLPFFLSLRAWVALRCGDLVAAEADARAVLDSDRLSALFLWRQTATATHVLALAEQGELAAAEQALEPLRADLEGTGREAAILRHARGCLRLAERRFAEALADLLAAGELATRISAVSPCFIAWRSDAALAQLGLGDSDAARRLSAEELHLARAFGAPRALGVALRVAGLAAGGLKGEPLLREAVEVLDGADSRLEWARALADLGALLRRSNRRSEARELLRPALDVAHRRGALPLASRVEIELRATGAKPRRVRLTGLDALTASERRIAELAAEGLTNRQIAQNLFVTPGTVEGHLTNVFTKLDIRTRSGLSGALRPAFSRSDADEGTTQMPSVGPSTRGGSGCPRH